MSNERWSPVEVKVWGPLACFTRPEMKVERVSYPVMTPSAARGLLEMIHWKPEFQWRIDEIWVLKEIRWFSVRRNEVKSLASDRVAREWAQRGGGYLASEDRAQRHTLGLSDVAYVIRAHPIPNNGSTADTAKHRDQFRRRVARGQCFAMPYLGCRELAASFSPIDDDDRPIERTEELGRMLLDLTYPKSGRGQATPHFFDARLEGGVLRVPPMPGGEETQPC